MLSRMPRGSVFLFQTTPRSYHILHQTRGVFHFVIIPRADFYEIAVYDFGETRERPRSRLSTRACICLSVGSTIRRDSMR